MSSTFTLGRAIAIAGLLGATAFPQAARDGASGIVINGKFDSATEQMLVPVTIGGHAFWCSPDSGFSALTALDEAKAIRAGLPVSAGVATPDGIPPPPGDHSVTTAVVVGGVTYANQAVIVRRFPEVAPDTDCVVGVALLRQYVVEIDHMLPRMTLYERATYRPPAGADAIPLIFYSNPRVPYVDIQMRLRDGATVALRVLPDTGTTFFSAILVGGSAARAQSEIPTARAFVHEDPQRVSQLLAARPRAITVGSFTVNEPVIGLVQGNLGADGSIADGTLGSGFLRRFVAAFDFDGHRMYLAPNERYRQPQPFDGSGIGFILRAGSHVVFDVVADSAGAKADVRIGDVLVQIDDRSAADLTPVQLRDLLSADGSTRRLVFERDGRTVAVVLRLKARV